MICPSFSEYIWKVLHFLYASQGYVLGCKSADGNGGLVNGSCPNRAESSAMNTKSRSLVLMNYFPDAPDVTQACKYNSGPLLGMMKTCYDAAGKRWSNFIAVDFYKVCGSLLSPMKFQS